MPLPASDDEVFWWSKALAGGTGGLLLLWKIVRMVRADNRTDKGADASVDGYMRTIAALTKESERKESIIANLSARLVATDDRLTVEIESRRDATHKALDAAQATLAVQHRLETAENANDALRTRVIALEQEIHGLKLTRPVAGDLP